MCILSFIAFKVNNTKCHKIVTLRDFIRPRHCEQATENHSVPYVLLVLFCTTKSSGAKPETPAKSV